MKKLIFIAMLLMIVFGCVAQNRTMRGNLTIEGGLEVTENASISDTLKVDTISELTGSNGVVINDEIYFPGIAETQTAKALYYNDATGLVTYGDTVVGGGGAVADSSWLSIDVDDISEFTADNGVTIESVDFEDGVTNFDAGTSYGVRFGGVPVGMSTTGLGQLQILDGRGADNVAVYFDGSDNMQMTATDIIPSTSGNSSIGSTSNFFANGAFQRVYLDNADTYIDRDGAGNMTFVDGVTSSKTLADLSVAAGNGWGATTTNTTTHTTLETTSSNDDVITIAGLRGSDSASIKFDPLYATDGPMVEIASTSSGTKQMYLQMSNYNGLILNKKGNGWMSVGSDSIAFNWQGGGTSEGVIRDNRYSTQGLVYYADYSADYTARSLPDSSHVASMIRTYTIGTQSGYYTTLVLEDAGTLIMSERDGSTSITVPPNSSVAFPIGTRIRISKIGSTGNCNIYEGSGVTINHWETAPAVRNYGTGELIKIDTDEWMLTGDIINDA